MGTERPASLLALTFVTACVLCARAAADDGRYERAIAALGGDHDAAVEAVRTLRRGGADASLALHGAWPTLTPLGRRRAVPALKALATRNDEALACLVEGATSPDVTLGADAIAALSESGPRGLAALEGLLSDPRAAPAAASALVRADPDRAVAILLRTIGEQGVDAPPESRQALTRALRRSERDVDPAFERWLAAEPSAAALAQVALALTSVPGERPLQTVVIERGIVGQNDFATDWRLTSASSTGGVSNSIDAWLVDQWRDAEPWMLRAAAVDALAARQGLVPAEALDDAYPRVRAHAALALAGDGATLTSRATMARRDVWPMVRAAAVESLQDEPKALPVIVAAVDDPMSEVRAAAIGVLTRAPDATGWERVHARLRNQDEWPAVVRACLDYVRAHCRRDAVEALYYVVKRAASPSARTDDVANAATAVETLRVLGTPDAAAILAQLEAAETLPQPLETALKRELSGPSGCASRAP